MVIVAILSACSGDEVTPEERLDEYVQHWNEQEYTNMYDMLSTAASEKFPTEKFVDRYKNIYGDLNVSDLKVTYEAPNEEEKEKNMEEGKATFPITVEMETIAGPITFNYEATLVQEENEDEETNWYVNWDSGYIFPALKNGGEISLSIEDPKRGEIFDRNQNGLAVNQTIKEIGIVPEQLGENPEKAKKQIAELLSIEPAAIEEALGANWVKSNLFVPLKKVPNINKDKLNKLLEINGVDSKDITGRIYPYGKATAHLTGYLGKITAEELKELDSSAYSATDSIGKRGLEQLFDKRLKGKKGVKIIATQEGQGDQILAEQPVKNGEDITLTIDAELQKKIFTAYQDKAGTGAAINPKTGETLALVSSPSFDPNKLTYGINQKDWDKLQNNPQSPLLNRFAATFAPGSAIKPVTGAIGLQAGTIKPGEGIEINGPTWRKDESWGNYEVRRVSESNGPVDLTDALVRSDNIYFAKKGVEMGSETLVEGLKQFGFSEDLPFTYPIGKSTVSSSGKIDSEVLLADTSYGQGEMQMSALHLAATYTPFLNQGKLIKPVLLKDEETSQVWKENLVTKEQAALIQDAMKKVVQAPNGTANGANINDVALSGKTGTAELKQSQEQEDGKENGWFVSYPTKEQDILIAMMVENTQDEGGSGYVVNLVADIFKAIR